MQAEEFKVSESCTSRLKNSSTKWGHNSIISPLKVLKNEDPRFSWVQFTTQDLPFNFEEVLHPEHLVGGLVYGPEDCSHTPPQTPA
ncbi:hypothetical protein O181_033677 [Austropuccinia psidii MF-1]|uniref:Uncharacterized protein n=1 Tax=Austropuccinia psidii MF-1 TaxID=1389203 RepID=A0A9Q3H7D9_9BASI|nr:hypothetical protein [Austropuccinia psidii MF-1]